MTGLILLLVWFTHHSGARIDFEPMRIPSKSHFDGVPRISLAPLLGGHSVCDPPDPIPNSAVKPDSADGTIA